MITTVLFDLDGTLLPLDQDDFIKVYFGALARKLAPLGYSSDELIKAIWAGTEAMVKNDGKVTNETVFWEKFCEIFGENARNDEPVFEEFYQKEFSAVKGICGYNQKAQRVIKLVKEKGLRTALATNPLFPAIATESRIKWAGLEKSDFELYTTYENSRFCKPNLEYYKEILSKLNLTADECLMVGNDVDEDMVAEKLGMKVFLLTDCLINKFKTDISVYPHGGFDELLNFIDELN